ncbi:MAG: hypothetical protein NTW87_26605, partial [Planctomycetota bacterium]|nr:hypothetical protein [Planctomycetota bacterium]
YLMQDFPRMNEAQRRRQKERQKEFVYPQVVDKGVVMARIKKHVPEEVKPLPEAREAIAKRLRILEAVDLAKEAATKVHDEWAEGKNLPPIDSLEEVRGDQNSTNPLVREFLQTPAAIGEVLGVADGPANEITPGSTDPNRHVYVGFAVERDLPTWDGFNRDTNWSRDDKRKEIAMSDYYSTATSLMRQLNEMGKVLGDVKDPPLFEDHRRGRPADDDE